MLKEHTTYRHFLSKKPSYVSRKRQVKHKSTKKDRSHNHLAKESCSGSRQTTHLITTVKQKMRQLQGRVLHFLIALLKKNKNKKKNTGTISVNNVLFNASFSPAELSGKRNN